MTPRFDYFKLCLPSKSVDIVDMEAFNKTLTGDGQLAYLKFKQKTPFSYEIIVDLSRNETYVSFSGKVLLDDYPNLISRANIETCFNHINMDNICHIHSSAISEAIVMESDITADIEYDGGMMNLIDSLILNHNYTITKKGVNRFYIQNTFVTHRKRECLVVYDKAKELSLKSNSAFLETVRNKNEQIKYFSNKIRLELNLRSKDRLLKYFHNNPPTLQSILNSNIDPLSIFLEQAIGNKNIIEDYLEEYPMRLREVEHLLMLTLFGFDLKNLEKFVKKLTSNRSSIFNRMRPYRDIYERLTATGINPYYDTSLIKLQDQFMSIFKNVFSPNLIMQKYNLRSLYESSKEKLYKGTNTVDYLYDIPIIQPLIVPD